MEEELDPELSRGQGHSHLSRNCELIGINRPSESAQQLTCESENREEDEKLFIVDPEEEQLLPEVDPADYLEEKRVHFEPNIGIVEIAKISEMTSPEESSGPEDWNSSEESEPETIPLNNVYDESRFLTLLDQRIADTEKLFDRPDFFAHLSASNLQELETQVSSAQILIHPPGVIMVDESTQTVTDEEAAENQRPILHLSEAAAAALIAIEPKLDGKLNESRNAKAELIQLRRARDSLSKQAKTLAKKMKQTRGGCDPDPNQSNDDRKAVEFAEAISAIDACIEFKNEIICGREYIFSNNLCPGMNETNLLTSLTSLTVLDLQRLLITMFAKVVEFQHSTKLMDKQTPILMEKYSAASRDSVQLEAKMMRMDVEHDKYVGDLIRHYRKDYAPALSDYLRHSKAVKESRKRINQLELALQDLLVRHGYLHGNETKNHDLRQVIKKLNIGEDGDERKKAATLRFQFENHVVPDPESQGRAQGGHELPTTTGSSSRRTRTRDDASGSKTHHHRHRHHSFGDGYDYDSTRPPQTQQGQGQGLQPQDPQESQRLHRSHPRHHHHTNGHAANPNPIPNPPSAKHNKHKS